MYDKMPRKIDYLGALEAAIFIKHNCKATHRETVFVLESTTDDETVWEGNVEVFVLAGHAQAKICYAWQHADERGHLKIFTVLESPFIDSAKKAVQAAIFIDAQPLTRRTTPNLEFLVHQLEECKSILRRIGTRAENLAATIETSREIKESISLGGVSSN